MIITQNFFILQYEKANTDLENSRLKAANLESANLFPKQQVHPHFLFNALSMLKSLYKSDVQAGEAYLSHLVNFLRDGLSFEIFSKVEIDAPVIFCTAFDEYALHAFQANGIDYLLKPFTTEAVAAAVNKYLTFREKIVENALRYYTWMRPGPCTLYT